jgi:hypothetical protein
MLLHRCFALLRVLGLILSLFCIFEVSAKPKVSASLIRNRRKAWERYSQWYLRKDAQKKLK